MPKLFFLNRRRDLKEALTPSSAQKYNYMIKEYFFKIKGGIEAFTKEAMRH